MLVHTRLTDLQPTSLVAGKNSTAYLNRSKTLLPTNQPTKKEVKKTLLLYDVSTL
jgi:hypothetical protein